MFVFGQPTTLTIFMIYFGHRHKGGMAMTTFRDVLRENKANIEAVARRNSQVNEDGYVTISKDDRWAHEYEWDAHYKELKDAEYGYSIAAH